MLYFTKTQWRWYLQAWLYDYINKICKSKRGTNSIFIDKHVYKDDRNNLYITFLSAKILLLIKIGRYNISFAWMSVWHFLKMACHWYAMEIIIYLNKYLKKSILFKFLYQWIRVVYNTRGVLKVFWLKLYLPRQKLTLNETLTFLEIVPLIFNSLLSLSFLLIKETWKLIFCFGLFVGILWHINLCRLFNAKYILKQINSFISNNSVYYKNTFQLSKTFLFQAIQFSQTVLIQIIHFSISIVFVKIVLFQTIQLILSAVSR